jgi:hypothetical protein
MDYSEFMHAKYPKPNNGGQAVPVIATAETVDTVTDMSTGVKFPIKQGKTGEEVIEEWEKENGNIDEPTFQRKQKRRS